jgi:hypothetical protein
LTAVDTQRSKSFFVRNLASIKNGSLRGGVLTLFCSTVGGGMLSLPMVISKFGLTSGVISLIAFGLLTRHTYLSLNDLITISGKKSYANVVSYFFGKSVARVFINFMIFQIVCSSMISSSLGTPASHRLDVPKHDPQRHRRGRLPLQQRDPEADRPGRPANHQMAVHLQRTDGGVRHSIRIPARPQQPEALLDVLAFDNYLHNIGMLR